MVLLEVARDALLQVARLAHVQHVAVRVEIAVDTGQAGSAATSAASRARQASASPAGAGGRRALRTASCRRQRPRVRLDRAAPARSVAIRVASAWLRWLLAWSVQAAESEWRDSADWRSAARRLDNFAMPWDLFCRVVDNFGDIGVCWRLAAQLADRGQPVRLWIDDAERPRMDGARSRARVSRWWRWSTGPQTIDPAALPEPGEVVDRGLRLRSAAGVRRPHGGAARAIPRGAPLWINLEYLSAEAQAERNHRLPSPQSSGPGAGLVKHFFYPGFTPASGGLLREADLLQRLLDLRPDRLAGSTGHRARARRTAGEPVLLSGRAGRCTARAARQRPPHSRRCCSPPPAAPAMPWPPGSARAHGRRGAAAHACPAVAQPARLRPPAVELRPQLRARRRQRGACAMGRATVRLAALPAAGWCRPAQAPMPFSSACSHSVPAATQRWLPLVRPWWQGWNDAHDAAVAADASTT